MAKIVINNIALYLNQLQGDTVCKTKLTLNSVKQSTPASDFYGNNDNFHLCTNRQGRSCETR